MGEVTINSLDTIKRMGNSLPNMLPSANSAKKALYGFGSVVSLGVSGAALATTTLVWPRLALDRTMSTANPYLSLAQFGLCKVNEFLSDEAKTIVFVVGLVASTMLLKQAVGNKASAPVNEKDLSVEANGNGHAPAVEAKAEQKPDQDAVTPRKSGRRKSIGNQVVV